MVIQVSILVRSGRSVSIQPLGTKSMHGLVSFDVAVDLWLLTENQHYGLHSVIQDGGVRTLPHPEAAEVLGETHRCLRMNAGAKDSGMHVEGPQTANKWTLGGVEPIARAM